MDALEFRQLISGIVREVLAKRGLLDLYALATVDAAYSSGRPQVRFDGESTLSAKAYPYLSSYAPAADDRVLMVRVRGTWTILGKVV